MNLKELTVKTIESDKYEQSLRECLYSFEIHPSAFKVLVASNDISQPTVNDIGNYLGYKSSNISQRIDVLEKKGLAERNKSMKHGDRREVMIELTTKGKKLLENVFSTEICDNCFKKITKTPVTNKNGGIYCSIKCARETNVKCDDLDFNN